MGAIAGHPVGPVLRAGRCVDHHLGHDERADLRPGMDGAGDAHDHHVPDLDGIEEPAHVLGGQEGAHAGDDGHHGLTVESTLVDVEGGDPPLLQAQRPPQRRQLHRHGADEGDAARVRAGDAVVTGADRVWGLHRHDFTGGRHTGSVPAPTATIGPVPQDRSDRPDPDDRRVSRRSLLAGTVATGLAAAGINHAVGSEAYAATTRAKGLGPGGSHLRPGSLPYPDLPAGSDTLPQIDHIVVLMMENHSFDDHLGTLGRGDGLTRGPDGKPVNYNPDPAGGFVRSFHNPNTCGESDSGITQSWNASHICWDHGTNMGFVKGCSGAAMGYWTRNDLPYYHDLASRFPIGDRYFCSVMAQTYPNRRFLIAGTALGDISTGPSGISSVDAPNGTIFDRLNQYGISWKDYYPDIPTCALFAPVFTGNPGKSVPVHQFFADAAAGTLPAFSLVDPYTNFSEEDGDISIGEAYAALVINAVMDGPAWEKTALIWVYDEHGGWYDHVPPQPAVRPDNVRPELTPGDVRGAYDFTGFRVPCAVVSAWSKKDYVSHQVFDHTSILKLVETKWNLPALTFRDANAHNMLDFFDLDRAPATVRGPTPVGVAQEPVRRPGRPASQLAHPGEHRPVPPHLHRPPGRIAPTPARQDRHSPARRRCADGRPAAVVRQRDPLSGAPRRRARSFGPKAGPGLVQLLTALGTDLGQPKIEAVDGVHQNPPDQRPCGVLVIGRHDVPRCPRCGGGGDGGLVGGLEFVPVPPVGQVRGRELPALGRVVQPLEEPLLLLVLRQVQEDLDHAGATAVQVVLEGVDVLEALLPQSVRGPAVRRPPPAPQQLGVDPHHQDLLVVGAVEDPDPPPSGKRPAVAPEEVVALFLGRRGRERRHLAPLGIDPGHHVLDGPVLAGGVHGLEHHQQRVRVTGPQQLLCRAEIPDEGAEVGLGQRFRAVAGTPRPGGRGRHGAPALEIGRVARCDRQLLDDRRVELHRLASPEHDGVTTSTGPTVDIRSRRVAPRGSPSAHRM